MTIKVKSLLLIIFLLITGSSAEAQIAGVWSGEISGMGSLLKIKVKFSQSDGLYSGNIDIPQQSAVGLRLSNIKVDSQKVHFELEAGPGRLATFDGLLKDSVIQGKLSQSGIDGAFNLNRINTTEEKAQSLYHEEEVAIWNTGDKLSGTLTIPDTTKRNPLVILISGSGAQNRDEEIFDFPIFKIIADHLVKNGYAVLRFDDRGIGGSTGNLANVSEDDFVNDVKASIDLVKDRKDINSEKIGLLGHSEGGVVASLAAAKLKNIAFIVLVASTGDNGSAIIKEQTRKILKINGMSDSTIEAEIRKTTKVHNIVINDKGWDEYRKELKEQFSKKVEDSKNPQYSSVENKNILIDNLVESQIQGLKSKWMKSFLTTNPAAALKTVTCPILAIFGEKDSQVDAKNNSVKIKAALDKAKNKMVTIKIFPQANHLFQSAKTGAPAEYYNLKKEFVPGFLDLISGWLLENIKK
jgi:alpha-beta hydrolase superfamily lysophospholipase